MSGSNNWYSSDLPVLKQLKTKVESKMCDTEGVENFSYRTLSKILKEVIGRLDVTLKA